MLEFTVHRMINDPIYEVFIFFFKISNLLNFFIYLIVTTIFLTINHFVVLFVKDSVPDNKVKYLPYIAYKFQV